MIIRVNSNNLLEMRNAVVATLYHCIAFGSEDHVTCILQYKWQSDKETGEKT